MTVVYLHYTGEKQILEHRNAQHIAYDQDDPLQAIKALGLNLGKSVTMHIQRHSLSQLIALTIKPINLCECTLYVTALQQFNASPHFYDNLSWFVAWSHSKRLAHFIYFAFIYQSTHFDTLHRTLANQKSSFGFNFFSLLTFVVNISIILWFHFDAASQTLLIAWRETTNFCSCIW